MKIWKSPFTLEEIAAVRKGTLVSLLAIEFTEIGDNYLKGRMPVDQRTLQPLGIMHGGASCVLAETLGSVAGCHVVEKEKFVAVGISIHTNHLRMATKGFVTGTATPIHLGGKTHVWNIEIVDDERALVSVTTLTLMVIQRLPPKYTPRD